MLDDRRGAEWVQIFYGFTIYVPKLQFQVQIIYNEIDALFL